MAQSVFQTTGHCYLDSISTSENGENIWNLGTLYLGGSKQWARRMLVAFDLYGPAYSGRSLTPADDVTDASMLVSVSALPGAGGWDCDVQRNSRSGWLYTAATWLTYDGVATWTTAGGDFATPPAKITLDAPVAVGEWLVPGLLEFVTDAMSDAQRGQHSDRPRHRVRRHGHRPQRRRRVVRPDQPGRRRPIRRLDVGMVG